MAMSKQMNDSFGGLQIRNTKEVNISLFCELCKLLQLHSTQLLCCGARLCRWCSKKGVSDSQPFICPFCQTKQLEKKAQGDRGAEREISTIKLECYACSWNGSYKDYLEHLQQDHANLECSDCHARFFAINSYEEHRQEICEYRCIPCGLPGCMELIKWSEMKPHYLSNKHQKLLVKFIIEYIISKKHLSNNLTSTSNILPIKIQELDVIQESIAILSPGLATLFEDSRRLRSEHDKIKTNCERNISKINDTKKIFNDDNEKVLKCFQSHDEINKEIEETKKLHTSINIILLDCNDSMLFPFCIHSEDINSSFSIYSPKFKTSSFGYLFLLRVCSTMQLEHHNQGFLSIYITLLRSGFDPILFYPFPYSMSLYLCDQSGQGKNIQSTIIPDPNSPSFACPTGEKNDEIGIVEFCPLSYLTDAKSIYLKDSVFFIRISFDFTNNGSTPMT